MRDELDFGGEHSAPVKKAGTKENFGRQPCCPLAGVGASFHSAAIMIAAD